MSAHDEPGNVSSDSAQDETVAGEAGHASTMLAPSISTNVGEAATNIAAPVTRIGMGYPRGSSGVTNPPLGGTRDRRVSLLPLHDLEAEGGRYRVGEQIGQGGMGEVLVAYDEQIGRNVRASYAKRACKVASSIRRSSRCMISVLIAMAVRSS